MAEYESLRARHDGYSADDFNVDAKYKNWIVEGVEAKGKFLSMHTALFNRIRLLNAWVGDEKEKPLGALQLLTSATDHYQPKEVAARVSPSLAIARM